GWGGACGWSESCCSSCSQSRVGGSARERASRSVRALRHCSSAGPWGDGLRDWRVLHVAAAVCAAPQALALSAYRPSNAAYAVFGMWLVLAAVPTWLALRTRLTYHPAWLLMFSAVFGGWCAGLLFAGNAQGEALL